MLFSIITCTHNPNIAVFKHLIKAVSLLKIHDGFSFEWLIIDNNSKIPIKSLSIFDEIIVKNISFSIYEEYSLGLANARIKGTKCAKGQWIVFFDDDNQPNQEYLINAYELINKYTFVKCWGPGNIKVIFLNKNVEEWIYARKDFFQEKHIDKVMYSREKIYNKCFPDGTGMLIEKTVLSGYIENVINGEYTLTGRLGRSLSSGEDTQIVFHTVHNGMHTGISPDLSLNHIIEQRKSTFQYLKKQVYTGCKSFVKAHNEVIVDNPYQLVFKDNQGVAKRIIRWIMKNYKHINNPVVVLDFFGLLGRLYAPYFVANRKPPPLLKAFVYVLVRDN